MTVVRFTYTPCPVTGKAKYTSPERAERAMEKLWREGNDGRHGRMPRKVYECEHCGWWHLSSSVQDERAAGAGS